MKIYVVGIKRNADEFIVPGTLFFIFIVLQVMKKKKKLLCDESGLVIEIKVVGLFCSN